MSAARLSLALQNAAAAIEQVEIPSLREIRGERRRGDPLDIADHLERARERGLAQVRRLLANLDRQVRAEVSALTRR